MRILAIGVYIEKLVCAFAHSLFQAVPENPALCECWEAAAKGTDPAPVLTALGPKGTLVQTAQYTIRHLIIPAKGVTQGIF